MVFFFTLRQIMFSILTQLTWLDLFSLFYDLGALDSSYLLYKIVYQKNASIYRKFQG
jgi:hypothetical protein